MNYKERFAGLNANEIIKRLEDEEKPFNPLDFGFEKKSQSMNLHYYIRNLNETKMLTLAYYDFSIFDKNHKYRYKLVVFDLPPNLYKCETLFNNLYIPNQRFGRELLENLEVI